MGYFPMCIDLRGREVLLIGSGPQTAHKAGKLRAFGAQLCVRETFSPADLTADTAFVVVGDTGREEAERISEFCKAGKTPVNVVDDPALSTFFFPALLLKGDLTVSVSTGGRCPGAAAHLSREIGRQLPDRTEEILDWLCDTRKKLYAACPKDVAGAILSDITRRAFALGRPLTDREMETINNP